ncbi:MAG: ATP-dependent RecD-like DNA helicase [Clostridia bacterium]|nr:ATP-dependent RecD-like DNA helicase [Clostridia bacterium]
MKKEYEGVIAEMIFHNRENGYTVAVFEIEAKADGQDDYDDYFTAVGTMPGAAPGKSYRIQGEFVENQRYGEQFAVSSCEEIMPSSKEGIRDFLASGTIKGVGRKTAAAIVAKFGEDTFDVIEKHPERLTEVSGVGEKVAAKIAEAYNYHREFAKITLTLQQYGISAAQALRLYHVYGSETVETVMENPYRLTEDVFGIGFRKADAIASKIGIEPDDEFRIKSGIKYTLSYFAGEGSTYLPEIELREKAGQLLGQSIETVASCLEQMAFFGDVHPDAIDGQRVVYLTPFYVAEQNVCRALRQLAASDLKPIQGRPETLIERTEETSGIKLSEEQKRAVIGSLGAGVSVITGGPGTGKTTIINSIINILEDSGLKVAIAAPTGRAAKRITETSGHAASTIHRLLEYSFFDSSEIGFGDESDGKKIMRFGKDEENPLDYDAVVVDEASMIDLMLMNGLVNAIRPGTRFIMVGDHDQLPSVGAGNVLRDIIASEYAYCSKLTEIYRQAGESMIVVNAHRINHGEYPDCNARDKDFFLLRRKTEKEMLATVKELCLTRLPQYYADLVPGGINTVRDIQVLTPVRKGTLGCLNLNRELQEVLNPPSEDKEEKSYGDRTFREGDKVMQIRNNYELQWKNQEDFTEGEGIFNGDVGFIQTIDKDFNEVTVIFDDVRYVTYSFSQLEELELAYAVTVHKSQGSEFPIIVMPISWFPPVLATRNLLYTGVTRGKDVVVLVGSEDKLNGMVDNNRISERYSGLEWRLRRLMNEESIQGDERGGISV